MQDYLVVDNDVLLLVDAFVHYVLTPHHYPAQKVEAPYFIGEEVPIGGIIVKLAFLTLNFIKDNVFNIVGLVLIDVVVQMPSPISGKIITPQGNDYYVETDPCMLKNLDA